MSSVELFESARKVIPGGVNSPVRSFKHVGRPPVFFTRAEGPYVYDTEGKSYIDFCLSFGPHLLGHCPPTVVKAIQEQAAKGMSFGACHPAEQELARQILRSYPFLDKVRMLTSGTEAVMTAIRLARGSTGRPKIVKFEGCYHGHSDGLLAKAGSGVAELSEASSKGIPSSLVQDTVICRYDDLSSIKEAFSAHPNQVAALILEPIPANHGLWIPSADYVREVISIARAHGALVIFDEVISGLRVGLGGAAAYYDQKPDLVTLGKVIGGGLPLAAVAGTAAVMDSLAPLGDVYQAGTMSGNSVAVAAGLATLRALHEKQGDIAAFNARGEAFARELESILKTTFEVQVKALGSIFWIHFGEEPTEFPATITPESAKTYASFFSRALEQGIYLAPSPYEVGFLSWAHTPDILEAALKKFKQCL